MSYFKPINNFKLDVELSWRPVGLTLEEYFKKCMPWLSREQLDENIKFIESVDGYEAGLIAAPRPMSYDKATDTLRFKHR